MYGDESFFSLLFVFCSLPLSLILCLSVRLHLPSFFSHHSTSIFNYFSLPLPHTLPFYCFFYSLPLLPPPSSPHPALPIPHCLESECTDFISDAVCHTILSSEGLQQSGNHDPALPSSSVTPPPNDTSVPPLIFSTLPQSVLSALAIYNMAIICLWQMKDLFYTAYCSLESKAVEVKPSSSRDNKLCLTVVSLGQCKKNNTTHSIFV